MTRWRFDLKNLTPEISDYLGFGFKRDYPAFPNTSIATMTTSDILKMQKQLFIKSFGAIGQNIVRSVLPASMFTSLKRLRYRQSKRLKLTAKG